MFTIQPINTLEEDMPSILKDVNRVVDSLVQMINSLESEGTEQILPIAKAKVYETLGGDLLGNFAVRTLRAGRITDAANVANDSFYILDSDGKPYFKDENGTSTALY